MPTNIEGGTDVLHALEEIGIVYLEGLKRYGPDLQGKPVSRRYSYHTPPGTDIPFDKKQGVWILVGITDKNRGAKVCLDDKKIQAAGKLGKDSLDIEIRPYVEHAPSAPRNSHLVRNAGIATIILGGLVGGAYGLRERIAGLFDREKIVNCASRVMTGGRGEFDCSQSGIQVVEKCNRLDPKTKAVQTVARHYNTGEYLELDPGIVAENDKDGYFTRFVQPGIPESAGEPESGNPYLTYGKFRFRVLREVPACAQEPTE